MQLLLSLLDDMLFAAVPAVGFALLFNVPSKALIYCGARRIGAWFPNAIGTMFHAIGICDFLWGEFDRFYRRVFITTLSRSS